MKYSEKWWFWLFNSSDKIRWHDGITWTRNIIRTKMKPTRNKYKNNNENIQIHRIKHCTLYKKYPLNEVSAERVQSVAMVYSLVRCNLWRSQWRQQSPTHDVHVCFFFFLFVCVLVVTTRWHLFHIHYLRNTRINFRHFDLPISFTLSLFVHFTLLQHIICMDDAGNVHRVYFYLNFQIKIPTKHRWNKMCFPYCRLNPFSFFFCSRVLVNLSWATINHLYTFNICFENFLQIKYLAKENVCTSGIRYVCASDAKRRRRKKQKGKSRREKKLSHWLECFTRFRWELNLIFTNGSEIKFFIHETLPKIVCYL